MFVSTIELANFFKHKRQSKKNPSCLFKQENYGKSDPACVAKVKDLYKELKLEVCLTIPFS
jgi:hypothetical protein